MLNVFNLLVPCDTPHRSSMIILDLPLIQIHRTIVESQSSPTRLLYLGTLDYDCIRRDSSLWQVTIPYFRTELHSFQPKRNRNHRVFTSFHTVNILVPIQYSLQVEPGKPGAEVSKKKNNKSKKEFANLPIECAQGDQPLRCPNRVF